MKATNLGWSQTTGWSVPTDAPADAQLVVFFGSRSAIDGQSRLDEIRQRFPRASIVGCSTGGQIVAGDVSDDCIAAIALKFERSKVRVCSQVVDNSSSFDQGAAIGRALDAADLRHVFVLSDGLKVNGSELVAGITSQVAPGVTLTGGLAGDGADFCETLVGVDHAPTPGVIAAIGIYGESLLVGHGSAGGWDEFGPKRTITRSEGNVLHDLDGRPALDLYTKYLGEEAQGLPGTGLLYPLLVVDPANPDHKVVRTILGLDRSKGTMTFAGNVPEGWTAQLMLGRFDRLADGAASAMRKAFERQPETSSDVAAIMVSCIGRRILMGQNIIDEIVAAESAARPGTRSIGFYSYGEISPHDVSGCCELHNQTMTVTTLSERM